MRLDLKQGTSMVSGRSRGIRAAGSARPEAGIYHRSVLLPGASWPWLAALLVGLLLPAAALAHPALDRALRQADEGEFSKALRSFDTAIESGTLGPDALRTLLTERAFVLYALKDQRALRADLQVLFAIWPRLDLGPRVSPAMERAVRRARRAAGEGVRLETRIDMVPGAVRISAESSGVPSGLGWQVEISARGDSGDWTRIRDEVLVYPYRSAVAVEYHARLLGPGGIEVVTAGSDLAPRRHLRVVDAARGSMVGRTDGVAAASAVDGTGNAALWWVGGGAALTVTGVLVAILVAGSGETDTAAALSGPRISY